jgi:pimeloyl-ACP methyl ester carboxylesterase
MPESVGAPRPEGGGRWRIHYEEFGAGHPMVLLHGWGVDTRRQWVETGWVAAFETVRRVIAIDCRGHGRSEKPLTQSSYSYGAMAEDVIAVMDDLGIERADLFGYSLGAFMAAWLLGHHPERFTSVIMGGIGDETPESAEAGPRIAAALRAADPKQIDDGLGRAYRAFVDADPTSDREALALAALQMWPEGDPLELGGAGLSDVSIPVLIVDGEKDYPYVLSVDRLVSAIPGARLVTVPGTDHLSVVADRRFRDAVVEFLS